MSKILKVEPKNNCKRAQIGDLCEETEERQTLHLTKECQQEEWRQQHQQPNSLVDVRKVRRQVLTDKY